LTRCSYLFFHAPANTRPAARDCIIKFSGRAERAVAEQILAATDVFSGCESTRTRGRSDAG